MNDQIVLVMKRFCTLVAFSYLYSFDCIWLVGRAGATPSPLPADQLVRVVVVDDQHVSFQTTATTLGALSGPQLLFRPQQHRLGEVEEYLLDASVQLRRDEEMFG